MAILVPHDEIRPGPMQETTRYIINRDEKMAAENLSYNIQLYRVTRGDFSDEISFVDLDILDSDKRS